MKRLLYLIPVILLLLSFTPFAVYKDKVELFFAKNPEAAFESFEDVNKLDPAHWKTIDYNVSSNFDLDSASFTREENNTAQGEIPPDEPVYKNAKFKGFPFGAYFEKSTSFSVPGYSSSTSISAFSWLWAAVDILLVLASLGLVFFINRRRPKAPVVIEQNAHLATPPVGAVAPNVDPNHLAPPQPLVSTLPADVEQKITEDQTIFPKQ